MLCVCVGGGGIFCPNVSIFKLEEAYTCNTIYIQLLEAYFIYGFPKEPEIFK